MKYLINTVTLLAIMFSASLAGAAEMKIGHLDLQRIVAESDAGKIGHELLAAKTKRYQDEINVKIEQVKKLKASQEAGPKKGKKSIGARQQNPDVIGERELQAMVTAYQNDLKAYDSELTRKVLDEFTPILQQYATANKYDYILRSSDGILFFDTKNDLTDLLIKEFNAKRNK
ncbi:MAG: OmpH family outer membrane protein [Chlorobiaceae bacterium]